MLSKILPITPRKIFLIGFMGCGKSKLGKSAAVKYNYTFVDMDDVIASAYKLTIPEIFEQFGENGFREREREVLQNHHFEKDTIIATGGGAPCFFNNMEWMNQNGITVFIDSPVKVLADRLMNARVERPLIKGKSMEELLNFIEMKLKERRPFYEQAQIILKGIDLTSELLFDAVKKAQIK